MDNQKEKVSYMTEQTHLRPELVIGLVCPLGARIDVLSKTILEELRAYGYEGIEIRVSDELKKCETNVPEPGPTEKERIKSRQEQAFEMRRAGEADVLARMAISAIRSRRREASSDPDTPRDACAYVVRQLKHPAEVLLLRKVYGPAFVLIAGSASESDRKKALGEKLAADQGSGDARRFETEVSELIDIDEKETKEDREWSKKGQNTRDTFPLADYFVDLTANADSVRRFVRLLFGHPFETPTQEEVAMHQAATVALRSSDERRQVGAVVVARTPRLSRNDHDKPPIDADIVASGANEVPRRQGGYYWPGEFVDARDQALRRSSKRTREDALKLEVVVEIAARLKKSNWLTEEYASQHAPYLGGLLYPLLADTQLTDIGEFSRQVHAEMAAVVDAAKRGVPLLGTEMYVTTFPCHNCAKHIIAAGIIKVIYLEPYPKSRAVRLHEEEIAEQPHDDRDKVFFLPFTGLAPRQFSRLFGMSERGRKGYKGLEDWERDRLMLTPRYLQTNHALAYIRSERDELKRLPDTYKWDRAVICPE